jgi:hypothetical protein
MNSIRRQFETLILRDASMIVTDVRPVRGVSISRWNSVYRQTDSFVETSCHMMLHNQAKGPAHVRQHKQKKYYRPSAR